MKYKEGDEFPATVVIESVHDVDYEEQTYTVYVKELDEFDYLSVTGSELLEAFDPEYKKQKLLKERERIDEELKKLGNI